MSGLLLIALLAFACMCILGAFTDNSIYTNNERNNHHEDDSGTDE